MRLAMRFKTDENLPIEAAVALRAAGHDALTVIDEGLAGYSDHDVCEVCRKEGRILITLDWDFADIRAYPPGDLPGIIVLRLADQSKREVTRYLARLAKVLVSTSCAGQLWIVEAQRIRVRT